MEGSLSAETAQETGSLWDVVIIGAGMGGGMTARSLAEAGFKVLLVDRGYKDLCALPADGGEEGIREGKWPGLSACEIDGKRSRHFGIFGAGLGGSTNLYAAALERFDRQDVEPLPELTHPTGGWAFDYNQLLPYYEQAERLLHVAGTSDPMNPFPVEHLREPPKLALALLSAPLAAGAVRRLLGVAFLLLAYALAFQHG